MLYVSPLKALAVDIERNLRAPLTGIGHAAHRLGLQEPDIRVAVRTGDTAAEERRKLASKPPDILITTPESLFLLLTSQARETLRGVETVIVDEVHAVAGNKRGATWPCPWSAWIPCARTPSRARTRSMEFAPPSGWVGPATVRPVEEVAAFLGGTRAVTVVQPPSAKRIELKVVVPVEDMTELDTMPGHGGEDEENPGAGPVPRPSIWPHVEERVLDLIEQHPVHDRVRELAPARGAPVRPPERTGRGAGGKAAAEAVLASAAVAAGPGPGPRAPAQVIAQAGEAAGAPVEVARAHHGPVSRQERAEIEEAVKATAARGGDHVRLELGIDMGAVDLVVQVEAPPSVASGCSGRPGRAQPGRSCHAASSSPSTRAIVQSAVVAERMRAGQIEEVRSRTTRSTCWRTRSRDDRGRRLGGGRARVASGRPRRSAA